jgi:hypothetical protein
MFTGPNTITNGLVLSLDAANVKSYVNGSTIWRDLSGNNNSGSLINGPTFNSANLGSIVFDGTNDYIATTYAPIFNDFSVIAWFKSTIKLSYDRIIDKNYINGMWIGRNSTTANSWGGGVLESSPPYGRFITLQDGIWHMIASIRQGTTHTIYGDGITNTTSGTVSSTALSATAFAFGLNQSTGPNTDPFGGNIASVQIYNRALTSTEVLQNYEGQKSRYNPE